MELASSLSAWLVPRMTGEERGTFVKLKKWRTSFPPMCLTSPSGSELMSECDYFTDSITSWLLSSKVVCSWDIGNNR